jgi:hypothetical protein
MSTAPELSGPEPLNLLDMTRRYAATLAARPGCGGCPYRRRYAGPTEPGYWLRAVAGTAP